MPQIQHGKKGSELTIDFPFQLRLDHPPIGLKEMFQISKDLDFHEVRMPDDKLEQVRHELIVDVLRVRATETLVEIKPRQGMPYADIAAEVQVILDHLSNMFKTPVTATELDWLVDRKGMASDQRSTQRRVL